METLFKKTIIHVTQIPKEIVETTIFFFFEKIFRSWRNGRGGGQGKKIYKSSENNQRGGGLGLRGIIGKGRKGG